MANAKSTPPTGPVAKRSEDEHVLRGFRTWAEGHGAGAAARSAARLFTVQLTEVDFDVELVTSYSNPEDVARARALAGDFSRWWDGDHGDVGVARNVVILDVQGDRIATQRL
ncbi:hypothetical protein ABT160_45860 [Streptomyces sp. NPDC001941]|uniref:hypothetical protein n=1 Tax=Streptomyces sp. NPDC001941 TaxID=3154659 RepID=UPI00332B5FB9